MNVSFESKAKRTFTMTHNSQTTVFKMGKFRTADKSVITKLLKSPEYKQKYIWLKTAPELVNKYITGEQPDRLTKEELLKIDDKGLLKIASHLQLSDHGNYPEMIRVMAEGAYVDNSIDNILKDHRTETPAEDLLDMAEEAGVIIRNGPWYQFQSPHAEKAENIGRDRASVAKFIREKRNKVTEAIELASNGEEKEEETEK